MGKIISKCFKKAPKSPSEIGESMLETHTTYTKDPSQKLSISDFLILKLLGKGSYAKVILVKKISDQQHYAIKVVKKKEILTKAQEAQALTEKLILEKTKSPFIVSLKFSFQNKTRLYMGMEFMPGGELFFHLCKLRRFNEEIAKFYIAEVILGLEYLHEMGIIYRDLKPENILLGIDGHIKLTDFGLSKLFSDNNFKTHTVCGTPEYQAPELVMNKEYGKSVDFWSIGCLLYELISGYPPFYAENRDVLRSKILSEEINFTRNFSESARVLIDKLLADFRRLKTFEFFDGIDWVNLAKKNVEPPYKPKFNGEIGGTENFDVEFTRENPMSSGMSPSLQSGLVNLQNFTYKDPELS